jgi:hypothetical protein
MGWGSATHLFDGAVDAALEVVVGYTGRIAPAHVQTVVRKMYDIGWDDWDTQDESCYFDPYLRDYMIELGEIDPDEEDGLVRPD